MGGAETLESRLDLFFGLSVRESDGRVDVHDDVSQHCAFFFFNRFVRLFCVIRVVLVNVYIHMHFFPM